MDIDDLAVGLETGRYPAGIYSDPHIFDLERDRVFARSWQFLAHESEVPKKGDFVVRRILDDSFIVVRGDDGVVRAFLNMCRHRGMEVCRAEAGNTRVFRCPYHAWTYRNNGQLTAVPFHTDAYGGDVGLERSQRALVSPPRVESYRGLIFACLDPAVVPLRETIGDFGFFLDLYINQSAAGIVLQGPQRWIIRSNWKIGTENFSGDSYHTPYTHASVVDIDLFREPRANKRKEGALYWAGSGGGTTYKLPTADFRKNLRYIGYPDEMVDTMRERWSSEQRALVGEAGYMVSASTMFPNLSLVHNWPKVEPGEAVTPFISLRLWRPVTATETEVYSWFVVDADAPLWYQAKSRRAYLMCFGSSGMFEQDDVENWTSITAVSRGKLAAQVALDSSMGMAPGGGTLTEPLADWPGPGRAYRGFGEYNQRELLRRWVCMLREGGPPLPGNGAPVRARAVDSLR
jgi:phenylpropionate dioxygenase-like ring-hydroxylating dioxygenase large terminal subunit